MRSRSLIGRLTLAALMIAAPSGVPAHADMEAARPPGTVFEWLTRQHQVLHRYLGVLRQAVHDHRYGYQTPGLLLPVAMDVFTGYIVGLHAMEEEVLYPALRAKMSPEQQQGLWLIEHDQRTESEIARRWQQTMARDEHERTPERLVEPIEALAQLVNRHIVLQEQRLLPILSGLWTPAEEAGLLDVLDGQAREIFGPDRGARYAQWLTLIEQEIASIATRLW